MRAAGVIPNSRGDGLSYHQLSVIIEHGASRLRRWGRAAQSKRGIGMRAQHFEFALSRAIGRSLASIHGQGERCFPLHPAQPEYLLQS
jgi:hypothetical protein